MEKLKRGGKCDRTRILLYPSLVLCCSLLILHGCDEDSTGPSEEPTGATLQGKVTLFDTQAIAVGSAGLESALTPDVLVSVGTLETATDANGDFTLRDIPLGNQIVSFSKSGAVGSYTLSGIVSGATFTLDQIQYSGGAVTTSHTGTWVGTGGSTSPGSQGQIALTMILQANGNTLTGTASVAAPDNSIWSITGMEDGTAVNGAMTLESSNSSCAAGATFTGTFAADTLSGTFVEVNPPAGCGSPENGTFRVVKQ